MCIFYLRKILDNAEAVQQLQNHSAVQNVGVLLVKLNVNRTLEIITTCKQQSNRFVNKIDQL